MVEDYDGRSDPNVHDVPKVIRFCHNANPYLS